MRTTVMASWMLLGGPGWALPTLASATTVGAPEPTEKSFAQLVTLAEEFRAARMHADAARTFVKAYDRLSERRREGDEGLFIVSNAVDDFKAARDAAPDDVQLLQLLEEEEALLERHGNDPKLVGGMPRDLFEELQEVERLKQELGERLAEARRREAQHEEDQRREAQPREEDQREGVSAPSEGERQPGQTQAGRAPGEPRRTDLIIVSAGIAATVGGVVMLANGGWNIGHVKRRSEELFHAVDASDWGTVAMRDQLRLELGEWRDRWLRVGTGLVVGGVVLAATGAGVMTWGLLRLRKRDRGPGSLGLVRPAVSRQGLGFTLEGRF